MSLNNTASLDLIPASLSAFIRDIERSSLVPEELASLPEYAEGGDIHKIYKAFSEARKILDMPAVQAKYPILTEKHAKYFQLPVTLAFADIPLASEDKAEYQRMEKTAVREIIDARFGGTRLAMDAMNDSSVQIREADRAQIRKHVTQKMGHRTIRMNKTKIEQVYSGRDYFSLNEQEIKTLFHYINALVMTLDEVKSGRVFGFVLIKLLNELGCLDNLPEYLISIRSCLPADILNGTVAVSEIKTQEVEGILSRVFAKIRSILSGRA